MNPTAPRALLFDLGGVLIDFDFNRALAAWQPRSRLSLQQLQERFSLDEPYQRLERGDLAPEGYYDYLASHLQIDAAAGFIEQGWCDIFVREIAETTALVRQASTTTPCYAFTNINARHVDTWMRLYPELASAFTRVFASHELRMRKPERRAFDHVCAAMGVQPHEVLFFDDFPENVQGARDAGLQAVLVRSPHDVRDALARHGILGA
jgi:putative hydrolase of the HAD superfamily